MLIVALSHKCNDLPCDTGSVRGLRRMHQSTDAPSSSQNREILEGDPEFAGLDLSTLEPGWNSKKGFYACDPASLQASLTKAVIKNVDMAEEMQKDTIDITVEALQANPLEKDIAAKIKRDMDVKFTPAWHVVVGKNFGSFVTHGQCRPGLVWYGGFGGDEARLDVALMETRFRCSQF